MRYYQAFKEKYPGITKAQLQWEAKVLRAKKITHVSGITFHYPNASLSSSGYNATFPSICNYPVQSLATAEIVPIALVAVWHILKAKEMRTFLNNTVHDSVIAESPDDELEELYEISKWSFLWWVYEFLDKVYGLEFNVPLGVGYQAASHWSGGDALTFKPSRYEDEVLKVDGGEVTVTAIPPVRMEGVDYSKLEEGN